MAIVFVDLDGTVLHNGKPAKGVIDTIRQLKEKGHVPVIATGRTPHLLYGIDKTLGIASAISANGSYISYLGQVVYEQYIPQNTVERMVETAKRLHTDLVFESVDGYVAYSKQSDLVDLFSDIFQIEHPIVDPDYHKTHRLLAFILFEQTHIDTFRQDFPELTFNQSNRFGYDVNLKGDLKADGVRWLIHHLGVSMEDVYAIGDGYNDISMLQTVKNSIAMGNAFPEVKAVARYITTDVDKNGVQDALRHFHLI
jgi:Cof subfamily protein (haloacid dehalogenase superfamily)